MSRIASFTADLQPVLTGLQGLHLYLSCYQLLLRHQCWALVKDKGLPEELEAIVKDLWALRLPLIQGKFVASQPDVTDDETGGSASEGEPRMYSSRAETEDATAGETYDEEGERRGKRKSERAYPSLVDSLALCYMGMMLLRMPISLGDMYR